MNDQFGNSNEFDHSPSLEQQLHYGPEAQQELFLRIKMVERSTSAGLLAEIYSLRTAVDALWLDLLPFDRSKLSSVLSKCAEQVQILEDLVNQHARPGSFVSLAQVSQAYDQAKRYCLDATSR
jgi:hypothetical protein